MSRSSRATTRAPAKAVQRTGGSPLNWWRRRRPEQLGPVGASIVRAAFGNVVLPGESHWNAAKRGDAAAAIRLALLNQRKPSMIRTDLIMSALLACAADGDEAARVVFSWARPRALKLGSQW